MWSNQDCPIHTSVRGPVRPAESSLSVADHNNDLIVSIRNTESFVGYAELQTFTGEPRTGLHTSKSNLFDSRNSAFLDIMVLIKCYKCSCI